MVNNGPRGYRKESYEQGVDIPHEHITSYDIKLSSSNRESLRDE